MEVNRNLRRQVLTIVNNQIRANKPPETKQTLNRLIEMGYSDSDARILIGQCVVVEIFDVLNQDREYDEARYIRNLKNLPKEPGD